MIVLSVLYGLPGVAASFVKMAFPRYAFKSVSDFLCLEPEEELGNPALCSVNVWNKTFYVKESFDEIVQQFDKIHEH